MTERTGKMAPQNKEYPYPEKGIRKEADRREARAFIRSALHQDGTRETPRAAQQFARRFSAGLTRYPAQPELPKWLLALIEKKASVREVAQTLQEHLRRAPSEENQELALIVANEIARMEGGAEELARHVTPELLARLTAGKGEES
jgi:hypothetical protein